MLKSLKTVLLTFSLGVLTAVSLIGCSFGGGGSSKGSTNNQCYIIKEDDYYDFCDNMILSENEEKDKSKEKYTVPNVEELTIGETYYAVGFTKASTSDGSGLEFKGGEIALSTESSDITLSDVLDITDSGCTNGNTYKNEDLGWKVIYGVTPFSNNSETMFVTCLEFTAKAEAKITAEYYVGATVKENTYGSANRAEATATAYYDKKVELSSLNVSYLTSDAYGNGRYDTSSLVQSIDMKIGKEYYMVITAKVKSLFTENNNETLTLSINVSPLSIVDGTLEEAGSGNFNETKTDTEKNISVSFKVPDASEGNKEITFIVKITPVSLGSPAVKLDFSGEEISIKGEMKSSERSLLINGIEKTTTGYEYTLSGDGSYYIVTDLGQAKGSIFLIPSTYNDKPVKEIGDNAFRGLKNIKSIEISEGIERIGSYAFQNCTSLLTVSLPSTATLGSYVLSGCTSVNTLTVNLGGKQLKSVFGSSNSSIPTALKTVTLVGDTTLCANAFVGGTKIESISLPATLTTVDTSALSGCTSLAKLTLDSQNQSLLLQCGMLYEKGGSTVLAHVAKFSGEMTYPEGLVRIPGGDMSGVTSIKVPTSATGFTTSVSNLAPKVAEGPSFLFGYVSKTNLTHAVVKDGTQAPSFSGATKLVSVTLPSTVTSLPASTFLNCESLTSVTLPTSLTYIYSSTFKNCKSLTKITIPDTVTAIYGSAFEGCESLTSVNIPSGVTSIGASAFLGCKKLKTVTLPTSFGSTIPEYLFAYCEALTSINISSEILYISENAFAGCISLTAVTLPENLSSIRANAFYGSGLKTVTVPQNVGFIGKNAFGNCKNLTAINVDEANTCYFSSNGVLYDSYKPKNIMQVPTGISGRVTVANGVTGINAADFENCTKVTEIVLPSSIGYVVPGAFKTCTALNAIWVLKNDYSNSTRTTCMTYNSSKRQMGMVSWKDPYELVSLLKNTYPDRYFFGTP